MSAFGLALSFLVGLWCIGILAGRGRTREALRITFSAPAFLVPAAMASVGCWALLEAGIGVAHESPFGLEYAKSRGLGTAENLMALALVAAALAGHVGLLAALRSGRPADGQAFARGIRDHFLTFALGKVALFAGIWGLSTMRPSGPLLVLYLVPNLLLAPLPGAAARHPRRPLDALASTLRTTSDHFNGVGNVVFGQILFAVGAFYAACKLANTKANFDHLAYGASTLGYGFFPFGGLFRFDLAAVAIALGAVASSVFVTAHFLCAEDGYASETDAARQRAKDEEAEARAAG